MDFFKNITSYDLFNHLIPGVLFAVLVERFTSYVLLHESIVIGFFVYYFVGIVLSRIGSLIIEPIFKALGFLKYAPFDDFVVASKSDSKIEILLGTSNMYRTLSAGLALLLLLRMYEAMRGRLPFSDEYALNILLGLLFILFAFSYRKQVSYISKRIKVYKP